MDELIRLEQGFYDPTLRLSRERLEKFLAPDFFEFTSNGKNLDREAVIQAVLQGGGAIATTKDFSSRPLGAGLVLLTYRCTQNGITTLRSSIWASRAQGWQVLFHQATVEAE